MKPNIEEEVFLMSDLPRRKPRVVDLGPSACTECGHLEMLARTMVRDDPDITPARALVRQAEEIGRLHARVAELEQAEDMTEDAKATLLEALEDYITKWTLRYHNYQLTGLDPAGPLARIASARALLDSLKEQGR